MQHFTKFGKRLLVSIEEKGVLILLKSRKQCIFVNFISREKRSKLPWVWNVKPQLKELFHQFFSKIKEQRPSRKPPADRKSNIFVAARIGQVVERGETEIDIKKPAFKITSSMPFACDECEKYEAMIKRKMRH